MFKIFLIIFFIIFTSPTFAGNDISITCTALSCTKSSELLFNELNIAPGFSKVQTVKVTNSRSDNCDLLFKLSSESLPNLLSSVQTISVADDNTVWYAGTIEGLYDNNSHQLGRIDRGQSKNYRLTISLNQSLGNDYQLLNNNFGLDFNFTCDEVNNASTTSDPQCRDSAPLQIPQNLKAISGQNSITLIWDEPSDYFTYYLIAYGVNDNASTYGNPNVGGRGTNSYIVNNLSADTTYYFKIRTGNGCAPGSFSTIVSATPSGEILSDQLPATSFVTNILGVANTAPSTAGNVKRVIDIKIILFVFIFGLLLLLSFKKNHKKLY